MKSKSLNISELDVREVVEIMEGTRRGGSLAELKELALIYHTISMILGICPLKTEISQKFVDTHAKIDTLLDKQL